MACNWLIMFIQGQLLFGTWFATKRFRRQKWLGPVSFWISTRQVPEQVADFGNAASPPRPKPSPSERLRDSQGTTFCERAANALKVCVGRSTSAALETPDENAEPCLERLIERALRSGYGMTGPHRRATVNNYNWFIEERKRSVE